MQCQLVVEHLELSMQKVVIYQYIYIHGKYHIWWEIELTIEKDRLLYTRKCATCVLHVLYTCNTFVVFMYITHVIHTTVIHV